ncbi:MAG: L-2-amino-thiazoline-4-carboxylic acid hydrolase [Dehalococcoidia bacterium]
MTTDERTGRDQRISSLCIIEEYYWMLLRHLHNAVSNRLGEPGLRALEEGFRITGRYRGEGLRQHPQTLAEGRDAMSLLCAWDVADLAFTHPDARIEVEGDAGQATVRLPRVPGSDYFASHEGSDILASYWQQTLEGIAAGYDEQLSVAYSEISSDGAAPWTITWTFSGDTTGASDGQPGDPFADVAASIRLSRRTFGVFAALCMYVARALTDRFDATGEELMRESLYNFGFERSQGMREQALREGLPINFQTFFELGQKRDPNGFTFVFRGDTHMSPGIFQATCTYCPCAEVWAEEGPDGLAFGYIYDMEVHRGLVEGFHPGGVVAWDKVKTRGDKVCDFRFSIPELVTKDDPEWARPSSK